MVIFKENIIKLLIINNQAYSSCLSKREKTKISRFPQKSFITLTTEESFQGLTPQKWSNCFFEHLNKECHIFRILEKASKGKNLSKIGLLAITRLHFLTHESSIIKDQATGYQALNVKSQFIIPDLTDTGVLQANVQLF